MNHSPRPSYPNPVDGNTYFLAPIDGSDSPVLWACPTNADGSADFDAAIPETDFIERLTSQERVSILLGLNGDHDKAFKKPSSASSRDQSSTCSYRIEGLR